MKGFVPTSGAFALLAAAPSALAGLIAGPSRPLAPALEGTPFALSATPTAAAPDPFELTHTRAASDRPEWPIPSIVAGESSWVLPFVPDAASTVAPSARWSRVDTADALPRWSPPVERPSTLSPDFDARKRVGLLFGAEPDRSASALARFIPSPGTAAIWLGAICLSARRRRVR